MHSAEIHGDAGIEPAKRHVSEASAALDTIVLLPDDKVFFVIWRAIIAPCVPEENDLEEVRIEYDELPWAEVGQ